MCVGGDMGAELHLEGVVSQHLRGGPLRSEASQMDSSKAERPDYILFNETSGCFIVEVENEKIAEKIFKNIPYQILGKTQKEKIITIKQEDKTLFKEEVEILKKTWQEPMKKMFG